MPTGALARHRLPPAMSGALSSTVLAPGKGYAAVVVRDADGRWRAIVLVLRRDDAGTWRVIDLRRVDDSSAVSASGGRLGEDERR